MEEENNRLAVAPTKEAGDFSDLNPRQELFCQLYVYDKECFGNATKSYAQAYDIDETNPVARSSASIELSKPYIKQRVRDLLDEFINDTVVDLELASVIKQNKELSSKVAAIREYNKLKQRVIEKTDITSGGKTIEQIMGMHIIQDENNRIQNQNPEPDNG